jgi:hypothetical protein
MGYTIGKSPKSDDSETIYVSDDARIAGKIIDILCEYINNRIYQENGNMARYIWKIVYPNTHYLKDWVNKHDVKILLDKFEIELKNRRKQ